MNNINQRLHNTEHSIINIRLGTDGVWASIKCPACSNVFEVYAISVGGISVGEYDCPDCKQLYEVKPEKFQSALSRLLPEYNRDATTKIMQEAVRITENWYNIEPVRRILDYHQVNLGQVAEKELLPQVVYGLLKAFKRDN